MPSFNFFKRRGKNVSNLDVKDNESHSNMSTPVHPTLENTISLEEALILLEKFEVNATNSLLSELDRTFEDTNQILQHINSVAEDLDNEEIEIEEEKLAPLVKNTKNTIVRALKRESSNVLSKPKNFEEFIKFKDSLDASINRFGEVTSSHSKIVNTFMKKHANSLRGDLKKISDHLEKLNDGYKDLSEEKRIIENCRSSLRSIKSRSNEINSVANTIKTIEGECSKLDDLIKKSEKEIFDLKSSSDYEKGLKYLKDKEEVNKERTILQENLNGISSHLVKAANKYSYGLTQTTVEKINLLVYKPEEVAKKQEMSEYLNLLMEVKESVRTNKIVLKDSNKIIQYFDALAEELPIFKSKIEKLDLRIEKLKDKEKIDVLNKVDKKEKENKSKKEQLMIENQRKNEILKSKAEFENYVMTYSLEIEEQFQRLSTKKYKLILQSQ